VPDLVAEMPQKRTVGLVHRGAATLALGVVALGDVDGDEAAGMPGHDLIDGAVLALDVGQELEGEAPSGSSARVGAGSRQRMMRVEEMPLRLLDAPPVEPDFPRRKSGMVELCRQARHSPSPFIRRQPVAGIVVGIGAEPVVCSRPVHGEGVGLIGLGRSAMDADRVVEIDGLAAMAALEDTHV
jgi:hypothetical protein